MRRELCRHNGLAHRECQQQQDSNICQLRGYSVHDLHDLSLPAAGNVQSSKILTTLRPTHFNDSTVTVTLLSNLWLTHINDLTVTVTLCVGAGRSAN